MIGRHYGLVLACASGVLLALSFPKFGHPAIGWIALAPLIAALLSGSLSRAFWLGLACGAIYFAGTLYWMTRVMVVYGGLNPIVGALINLAFVLYVACYPALFAIVVRRLIAGYGLGAVMAAPFVWVATELGRAHLLSGFPWVLLGYSQATVLPIAQLASVIGVYGVSALVISVSAALVLVMNRRYAPAVVVAATLTAVAVWGSVRVGRAELDRAGQPVRVGLIQANVDQGEKMTGGRTAEIFQQYLDMTRQAIGHGAEFVIWPESSTPFMFEEDAAGAERLRTLARQARVPILLGSDQIEWRVVNGRRMPARYFNSAFLVRPDGLTGGVYRKMHLVPWGEYVPLKEWLFFVKPLVEAVSDFSPGSDVTLLPLDGHKISTAICYEIVYPDLVREFVEAGSELITTITNDAWFGPTSAPYQHFEQASMRAIEEGRYLVRSANTGISGIVDPYGRVVERTRIYQTALVVGEARFLRGRTVYSRMGDAFAYAAVGVTVLLLVFARRRVE